MIRRVGTSVGLIALAFWAPWYILFVCVVIATLLIHDYYEGVVIGLFFDLVYGNSSASGVPVATVLAMVALIAGPLLRARLRWYS